MAYHAEELLRESQAQQFDYDSVAYASEVISGKF
jgi:hypothetical protein